MLKPLGFQPAHFSQYIALYMAGLVAARNNWLNDLPVRDNRFWTVLAAGLILVGFPGLYLIKILTGAELSAFTGGPGLPSLLNSLWEQLTGFAVIMGLSGWFKSRDRKPGPFLRKNTRSAYAVYIIHPLILVAVTVIALGWPLSPALKFFIVAPVATVISFLCAAALVRIPRFDRVL